MNQKSRRVRERTRGKEQSYFKVVFCEGDDNWQKQDSDSAAEADNDDNADDR